MMQNRLGLAIVLAFLLSLPLGVAQARPKIGLVLGGGGAAGVAHIGVLKVLEENHIPVDVIAGNSMGAVIGSLYASGMSAADIEKVAKELDWIKLFSDDPSHQIKSFQQKQQSSDFFSAFSVGLSKDGVKLSSGLIDGQRLMFELRRLLAPVEHISDFDRLPIPFRAVATDIRTGETVVLQQGNLATAVRASMSIPGLFAPVTINKRLLVDGLVSNNLPVDIARQMGADILIVSSIPPDNNKKLESALDISVQAMDLLMRKTSAAQLASLTPQDILIQPPIGDIGSLEFNRVAETIPLGVKGARAQLAALQRLAAVSQDDGATSRQAKLHSPVDDVMTVASIQIENDSSLSEAVLREKLGIRAGDKLDDKYLQAGLDRLYSLGYFSLVDYSLHQRPGGDYDLKVMAHKSAEGDKRISAGFALGDDFNGDTRYQAGVKYVRQGLTDKGTELRAQGVIGNRMLAQVELYHPLRDAKETFVAPRAWYQERDATIVSNGQQLAALRAQEIGGQTDVGRALGNAAEMRAGVFYQRVKPQVKTGTVALAADSLTEAGIKLRYQADTLDSVNFPTKGGRFTAEYTHGTTGLGSDANFSRIELEGEQVWSKDKHRFIASGRTVANSNNEKGVLYASGDALQTGRLAFSDNKQLIGNYTLEASLTYMRQLAEIPHIAKLHVGASVGESQAWQQRDAVDLGHLRTTAGVFVGGETPVGPAFVGIRKTQGFDQEAYFNFGWDF
jgi:NTE family protein